MKIIKKGNSIPNKWWHGKQIACWNCNQIVELENSDELSEWTGFMGRKVNRIVCQNCKEYITVKS